MHRMWAASAAREIIGRHARSYGDNPALCTIVTGEGAANAPAEGELGRAAAEDEDGGDASDEGDDAGSSAVTGVGHEEGTLADDDDEVTGGISNMVSLTASRSSSSSSRDATSSGSTCR